MLAKVEYGGVHKYIKIPPIDENFDFQKFLQEGLSLHILSKKNALKVFLDNVFIIVVCLLCF